MAFILKIEQKEEKIVFLFFIMYVFLIYERKNYRKASTSQLNCIQINCIQILKMQLTISESLSIPTLSPLPPSEK